ncbi:MAG TPA: hypothetical protein DHW82_08485 [Spirochaetia bacterium]|nr:MAG: hypothetical protein A2Y41_13140 [Spirochaetes bacterium GWB1_36_13]HCL57026.1 hypothetical protein [Spirochaetia bacterium]
MSHELSPQDKVKLIRKANEFFNRGEMEKAAKLFWLTDYKDGLIRMGEYLLYQEKKPFQALHYFQKANHQQKINEIIARMLWAVGELVKKTP